MPDAANSGREEAVRRPTDDSSDKLERRLTRSHQIMSIHLTARMDATTFTVTGLDRPQGFDVTATVLDTSQPQPWNAEYLHPDTASKACNSAANQRQLICLSNIKTAAAVEAWSLIKLVLVITTWQSQRELGTAASLPCTSSPSRSHHLQPLTSKSDFPATLAA